MANSSGEDQLRRKTVAVATIPFLGHSTPLAAIGAGLLQDGIRLQFLFSDPADETYSSKCKSILRDDDRVQFLAIEDQIKIFFKTNQIHRIDLKVAIPAWTEALRHLSPRPDLIIVDALTLHAAYAADALGIPFAFNLPDSIHTTMLLRDTVPPQNLTELMFWFNTCELGANSEYPSLQNKAQFHLVNSFSAWQGPTRLWPENIMDVGPQTSRSSAGTANIPDDMAQWLRSSKDPVVFLSTGSNFTLTKAQVAKLYLGMCGVKGVRFLWALRTEMHSVWDSYDHDRFHIVEWVPQKEVLANPLVKMMVYHGGFNGICEALQEGKPMLLIPIAGDQFVNADNAVMRGVALQVDKDRMSAGEITKKVQNILASPAIMDNVRIMRDSILATGGSVKSVQIIKDSLLGYKYAASTYEPPTSQIAALYRYFSVRFCCRRRAASS